MPHAIIKLCLAFTLAAICLCASVSRLATSATNPPRQMEKLGRGVIAINQGDGKVYVGWRMLGMDPDSIAFNHQPSLTRRGRTVALTRR